MRSRRLAASASTSCQTVRCLWRGVFALLAALVPLVAAAAPELYGARVPLTGSGGAALDAAFARALAEVFVKVSGSRAAGGASTRDAGALVRQYQPQADGLVRVQFDPAAVRARLDAAGLPVWVAARPLLLVVLPGPVPGQADPAAIGPLDPAMSDPVAAAASARGLEVMRSVPAGFPGAGASDAELLARAAEVGAGAVLLARNDASLGARALRFTLVGPEPGLRSEWSGDAAAGVDGAADRLAQRLAAPPGSVTDLPLRVTGIDSFAAYLRLAAWFESQAGVESAALGGVAADGFRYRLRVRGGAPQFRALLAIPGAVLAPAGDDGVEPVYRLVGPP